MFSKSCQKVLCRSGAAQEGCTWKQTAFLGGVAIKGSQNIKSHFQTVFLCWLEASRSVAINPHGQGCVAPAAAGMECNKIIETNPRTCP